MRTFLTIILGLFTFGLCAQQLPLFAQYREAHGFLNPASLYCDYLLYDTRTAVGASMRSQWVGIKDNPKTQLLHGETLTDGGLLTGGYIINDQVGRVGTTGIYGKAGFVISSDPEVLGLSLGLTAGLVQYRIKTDNLPEKFAIDPLLQANTAALYPDIGAGVYYYQKIGYGSDKDILYGGISIPQVFGLKVTFRDDTKKDKFDFNRTQHFYGTLGYIKRLNDEFSFIEPSVWVKYTPNAPLNIDINFRYQISNLFWIGAGYNTAEMVNAEAGFLINMSDAQTLKIGYAYGMPFSKQSPYTAASHEINLSMAFGQGLWK
jgi:type IX secretion system PorP/SprF family membrane protein